MDRLQVTQLALVGGVGLLSAVSADGAGAGDWKVSARAAGTLTLTDNVKLAGPGQEESDLVLGARFPLGLRREGSRAKFVAEYVPTAYLYANSRESDNLQNNLRSLLTVEAADDLLFVDASANIYQTYISPFGPRPVSGASATENRTEQITLGLSPYMLGETSRGWTYRARNDNFWTTYSEGGLADTVVSRVTADTLSPPARLRFGFDYTYLYTREESGPTSYYQQVARVRPTLRVTRKLEVSGRLGYETNDYVNDYSGAVYGAGIDWTPTPRTRLHGFIEDRFFGASYNLQFNHRTRLTSWTLRTTRDVYTTVEQPLSLRPGTTAEVLDDALRTRIPDPVERERAVKQVMERAGLPSSLTQPYTFYTNQPYVAEQWTSSLALLGRRNTATLTLFWQENKAITTGGGVLPDVFNEINQFRQQGFTLTVSHRLSGFSTVTLTANRLYSHTSDAAFGKTREDTVAIGFTRRLSPKTDGSISLRWVDFDSDANPYRELAATVALGHSF